MATVAKSKRATQAELRDALERLCGALDRQTANYPKSANVRETHALAKRLLSRGARLPDPGDE